ncbi:MAG: hypothetical protein ABSG25_00950 [Bryobacteraceae bacterium]
MRRAYRGSLADGGVPLPAEPVLHLREVDVPLDEPMPPPVPVTEHVARA